MHATHQFFLSRRSIYIIMLNAREDPNPEYWLNHIKSFGGNSPVIIVINKTDENPSYDVNRLFLKEKSGKEGLFVERFKAEESIQ